MIPSDSSLRLHLLKEFHSSLVGGHAGVARTFHRLASIFFFWKGMRKDGQTFVASYQTCQQMKDILKQPAGLLQPLLVAAVFASEIIRLHGHPKIIVTDRDPRFMNSFWKELHRLQGTTLSMSNAYHPYTDGQLEALNKCIEQNLCFFNL